MTRWTVEFTNEAEGDLACLDRPVRKRIIEKLEWLAENFDSAIPLPLTGEFGNYYKLRVGGWRTFYRTDHVKRAIIVCYIDRRDKAYKKKRS